MYGGMGDSLGVDGDRVQTGIGSIWDKLRGSPVRDLIPVAIYLQAKRKFISHPDAIGAADATLIGISRPANREDDKAYYSGRHGRDEGGPGSLPPDGT